MIVGGLAALFFRPTAEQPDASEEVQPVNPTDPPAAPTEPVDPAVPPTDELEPEVPLDDPVDDSQDDLPADDPALTDPAENPAENPAPVENNDPVVEPPPPPPAEPAPPPTESTVPGFPPGTSEDKIKEELGEPVSSRRGYWPNTRAVRYDIVPNQVTLGYIFDRDTGRLRQSEAAFAQSVPLNIMQTTLNSILNGQATTDILAGLGDVRSRSQNRYAFYQNNLEGVIERNSSDRIYIGVWDEDLH
jgi:serine/threonine-protein kinase